MSCSRWRSCPGVRWFVWPLQTCNFRDETCSRYSFDWSIDPAMIRPSNLGQMPQLAGHPWKVWLVTCNFRDETCSRYSFDFLIEASFNSLGNDQTLQSWTNAPVGWSSLESLACYLQGIGGELFVKTRVQVESNHQFTGDLGCLQACNFRDETCSRYSFNFLIEASFNWPGDDQTIQSWTDASVGQSSPESVAPYLQF